MDPDGVAVPSPLSGLVVIGGLVCDNGVLADLLDGQVLVVSSVHLGVLQHAALIVHLHDLVQADTGGRDGILAGLDHEGLLRTLVDLLAVHIDGAVGVLGAVDLNSLVVGGAGHIEVSGILAVLGALVNDEDDVLHAVAVVVHHHDGGAVIVGHFLIAGVGHLVIQVGKHSVQVHRVDSGVLIVHTGGVDAGLVGLDIDNSLVSGLEGKGIDILAVLLAGKNETV